MPQTLARDEAGHIWELDAQGNAVRLHQPAGGSTDVSRIVAPSPVRVAKEAQDRARQDEADARARRDQASQEEKDRRAALEWAATHNPDGTKKVDETPDKLANIPATGASGIQENIATLRKIRDAIAALDPVKGRPESVGPGTGALGQTFTNLHDPDGTNTRAAIAQVGAQKIHDLSGAAVSASEAPRFMPFVPTVTDPPEVALEKLKNFEKNLRQQIGEAASFYSPANGYRPYTTPGLAEVIGGTPETPDKSTGPSNQTSAPPSFGGRPLENVGINPEGPHKGVDPRTLGGAAEGYADPGAESIATQFKSVPNPEKAKAYSDLITFLNGNPNANDADVRSFVAGNPIYPSGFADSLVEYHNKTHRWAAAPGDLNDQVPLTDSDKTYNRVFGGPEATGIISAANAGSFGLGGLGASIINPESARKFDIIRTENPKSALAGDIAGSLAGLKFAELGTKAFLPKLTDGMVERGWMDASRAGKLVAPVSEGVYGGVTGAASNPEHPFKGGALGAILTPAGGGAGRMVGGRLVEPAARGVGRMFGRGEPVPSTVDAAITKATGKDNLGDILKSLTEAKDLNLPMMLADTNPGLRSLAGASVRRSPTASGIAEDALLPRGRGQIDRFQSALQRTLGPTENIPQLTDDMIKAARAKAGPLYDQAYAAPPIASPKIDEVLGTPFGQDSLKRAISLAKNERVDPNTLSVQFDAAGDPVMMPTPSTRTLDYVKRGMDDVLEQYRNPITGNLELSDMGRTQLSAKNDLLSEMDRINPAYRDARAAYAGPAQERDWITRGQGAYKQDPNTLSFNMQSVPPDKLPMAQLGYRGALSDAGNSVGYGSNPFERTLGSPAAESRLGTMYPDSQGPSQLLRQRDLERQMQNTSNDILGNSKTAQRGIADEAFAGENLPQLGLDLGLNLMTGQVPIGTMMKANLGQRLADAYKLGMGKRAVAKADALAPVLLNPNPASASDELVAAFARMQSYSDYLARRQGLIGRPLGAAGAGAVAGYANQ